MKDTASKDTSESDKTDNDSEDSGQTETGSNLEGDGSSTSDDSSTSEPVVSDGGSDSNVKQTIVNPDWKPVGTTQTGEHISSSDPNSADWKEKELALSHGAGIDHANMTVWWLESNGDPNNAIGTISGKGSDQTYRVYIEWVDGQGWKPVKVEELIENDKK
nr:YrrS family protein [Mesobacillus harenae]